MEVKDEKIGRISHGRINGLPTSRDGAGNQSAAFQNGAQNAKDLGCIVRDENDLALPMIYHPAPPLTNTRLLATCRRAFGSYRDTLSCRGKVDVVSLTGQAFVFSTDSSHTARRRKATWTDWRWRWEWERHGADCEHSEANPVRG
jgi:hypothetical protein